MNRLLNIRVGLLALAVLLAGFGVSNGFVALFHQARYEVVWNYDVIVTYCTEGNCAYSARLSVANTGKKSQELVRIALNGLPPDLGGTPRVTNFSAAEPRTADPVITQEYRSGDGTILLENLTPGALVEFDFSGFLPEAQLPAKDATQITVKGRGRVIEADPRALAFGRYVT